MLIQKDKLMTLYLELQYQESFNGEVFYVDFYLTLLNYKTPKQTNNMLLIFVNQEWHSFYKKW